MSDPFLYVPRPSGAFGAGSSSTPAPSNVVAQAQVCYYENYHCF